MVNPIAHQGPDDDAHDIGYDGDDVSPKILPWKNSPSIGTMKGVVITSSAIMTKTAIIRTTTPLRC